MSTKRAVTVHCDNPKCELFVEVVKDGEGPLGWYRIEQAKEAAPSTGTSAARRTSRFDVCSLDCLAEWALERGEALALRPIRHIEEAS